MPGKFTRSQILFPSSLFNYYNTKFSLIPHNSVGQGLQTRRHSKVTPIIKKKKGKMIKLEQYSPTSPAVTSIFNLNLFMEKSNQKQKRKC